LTARSLHLQGEITVLDRGIRHEVRDAALEHDRTGLYHVHAVWPGQAQVQALLDQQDADALLGRGPDDVGDLLDDDEDQALARLVQQHQLRSGDQGPLTGRLQSGVLRVAPVQLAGTQFWVAGSRWLWRYWRPTPGGTP
jgi:hypothetical protein